MASYSVVFKPSVHKDIRNLPREMVPRVTQVIEGLATNPFPAQALKLAGAERLHRIRIGDYRVVYQVDTKTRLIMIHYVRHRREVYRAL